MSTLGLFSVFCLVLLLGAIVQGILSKIGKDNWAKALHYAILFLGIILLGEIFLQLLYMAEEILIR